MKYLKPITHKELSELWGFPVPLPIPDRNKQLYLVVKKDGTPHRVGGGRYITKSEIKSDDVIL